MTQNRESLLTSFNPFITHPFTNGSGLIPRPTLYPALLPPPHAMRSYHPETFSPDISPSKTFDSSSVASTDSSPSSRSSTPMHSPKPRASPMVSPPPSQIFEQFRKEATTPELVLKKRPVQSRVVSRAK